MPAAMAIVKSFVTYMNIDKFTIGGAGLREGIMFNQALPMTLEKPVSDVLSYSLETLVRYYDCDPKHVEHVVHLSIQLFKQLRVLHKFSRQYLKVLKIAASLHDCGMRIKYYNHQKHSCYMILNSSIYGATHREIVLAAFVACCHKKEDISLSDWQKYKDIVLEEDLDAVKKLGVLLRIAESLDRSASGMVSGVNCDVLGDSVIMKTEVTATPPSKSATPPRRTENSRGRSAKIWKFSDSGNGRRRFSPRKAAPYRFHEGAKAYASHSGQCFPPPAGAAEKSLSRI